MTAGHGGADRERTTALLLGLLVVLFWGLSFVATRVAVAEIGSATLAFLRFVVALGVLGPLARRARRRERFTRRDRIDAFLLGLLGVTVGVTLENVGLERTTAAHGALLVCLTPLASALTEAAYARRGPPRRVLLGLLVAFVGVALVVGRDTGAEATLTGDLLILATVPIWVAYGFLARRLSLRHDVVVVTNVSIVWGVVTLLPLALVETGVRGLSVPSGAAVLSVLALGALCSALAYLWWNRALLVLGITTTNSLIYGIPLVAVVGGVVLLGEPLTFAVAAGGALVVGGLALANVRARPAAAKRVAGAP